MIYIILILFLAVAILCLMDDHQNIMKDSEEEK